MPRLNKITLIGHLGNDPEVRTFTNGGKAATFTVATDDSYRDQQTGNRIERTDWHRCVIFAPKIVESVEKMQKSGTLKGKQVYIEGKLRTRNYDDKNGEKRYVTEIVILSFEGFQLLGKRDPNAAPPPENGGENGGQGARPDDDIPF